MLETNKTVYLNLQSESNIQGYFYNLVDELKDCTVNEIRPIKTIRIDKGISTSIIIEHVEELKSIIHNYIKRRNFVFQQFLSHLKIDEENELFRNIRLKIGELNSRQRGIFGEWNFWQHGGDIEFENEKTKEHLNVSMHDKGSINASSLLKFVNSMGKSSLLNRSFSNDIKSIQKGLDILVLEDFLVDMPNEYGMKILRLKE